MYSLAFRPNSVPSFRAARSMSPVEICGIWYLSFTRLAWVPFPAPGPPNNIKRMYYPPSIRLEVISKITQFRFTKYRFLPAEYGERAAKCQDNIGGY